MNVDSGSGSDFDELLERELQRQLGRLQGPRPMVAQSTYHTAHAPGGRTMSLLSTLTAAASPKAAAAVLATAAVVVGGGSVAAAATTGSSDPTVWGKTVTAAVNTCKSNLTDGHHGIGQCVQAVATQKGEQERAAHSASAARQNQPAAAAGQHPATASTSHPTGPPTSHPTGAPTSHPEGRPTGIPAGPPTSLPPASGGTHPTGPPVTPPTPR
jgi:hypothetical protein